MTWLANSLGRVFGLIKKWNRCTHHDHRWTGIIPLLLLFFSSSSFLIFNPTIYVNAIAITFPFFFPRGERKINVSFHTLLFFLFFHIYSRTKNILFRYFGKKEKLILLFLIFIFFYIHPRNMIIIFRFNRQANIPFISHFIIANI